MPQSAQQLVVTTAPLKLTIFFIFHLLSISSCAVHDAAEDDNGDTTQARHWNNRMKRNSKDHSSIVSTCKKLFLGWPHLSPLINLLSLQMTSIPNFSCCTSVTVGFGLPIWRMLPLQSDLKTKEDRNRNLCCVNVTTTADRKGGRERDRDRLCVRRRER